MRGLARLIFFLLFFSLCVAAGRPSPPVKTPAQPSPIENAFQTGWMLVDTNGDGIANFLRGHVIVPANPTAAENAAAANLAARLGYGTSGLTLPVVQSAPQSASAGPEIFIGKHALPPASAAALSPLSSQLGPGEGGVFLTRGNLAILGADAPGLLAAATGYASRAPYQWLASANTIASIAGAINKAFAAAKLSAKSSLVAITYANKVPGIHRAILRVSGTADAASVRKALAPEGKPPMRFPAVKELVLLVGSEPPVRLLNPTPLATPPLSALKAPGPKPLDLGELYTIKGLLGGEKKMPVPASVDARFYVPAGKPGIAMANLAARVGLETTGITFPLASVPTGVSPAQVKAQAVVTGDSSLGKQLVRELTAAKNDEGASFAKTIFPPLSPGEGELRAVDRAFGKHAAILVRGDAAGQAAALDYAAGRLPFLWRPDKRYESIAQMRYSLHRFFSLRSAAGQASAALFHLNRWLNEIEKSAGKPASIDATVYVDRADPKLASFIRRHIDQSEPGAKVTVHTGSLHAGLKCCTTDPPLHYVSRLHPFAQAKPTFSDDFTIPWEGRRLIEAVRRAAPGIQRGQSANLRAEVSESPAVRTKLTAELREILLKAGAKPAGTRVEVLSAYKPGYSWLMEEIAPELQGKLVSKIVIEFQPDVDPTRTSLLYSHARWLQELYPVDAMLSRTLHIPLRNI